MPRTTSTILLTLVLLSAAAAGAAVGAAEGPARAPAPSAWTPEDHLPPLGDRMMAAPSAAPALAAAHAARVAVAPTSLERLLVASLEDVHARTLDVPPVVAADLATEIARAHDLAGEPMALEARVALARDVAALPPGVAAALATLVAGANAAQEARGDPWSSLAPEQLRLLVANAQVGKDYAPEGVDTLALLGPDAPEPLAAAEQALAAIDQDGLWRAHVLMARAVDDAVRALADVEPPTAPAGATDVLFSHGTPYGDIVVTGGAGTLHEDDRFVSIDLGGNDVYASRAGGVRADLLALLGTPMPPEPTDPAFPAWVVTAYEYLHRAHNASVVIDLGGDERYDALAFGAQGFGGFGGFGALVDLSGNDAYSAARHAQGAGTVVGAGFLVDADGADTYALDRQGQGYGQDAGAGFLADAGGADKYVASVLAQGTGFSANVAALLVDADGNDVYVCTGIIDSSDSILQVNAPRPGSICHGVGFGGVGALVDAHGDDAYTTALSFQAMALVGVGMLVDGDGNDRYVSHEWSNGIGILGAGVLVDLEGNDVYDAQQLDAAPWADIYIGSNGMGYIGVGVLADGTGDDTYFSAPRKDLWLVQYACGVGCAHGGGVGLLVDGGGNDVYVTEMGEGAGRLGTGILLDAAGDDTYALTHGSTRGQAYAENGVINVVIAFDPADCYYGILWDGGGTDAYSNAVTTFGARGDNRYWGHGDFGRGMDAVAGTTAYLASAHFVSDVDKLASTRLCETASGPAVGFACLVLGQPDPVC